MSKGQYQLPTVFSGIVTRDGSGEVHCTDKAVDAILRYVRVRYPEEFNALQLPADGSRLGLPLDNAMFSKTAAFEAGCKAYGLTMEDGQQVDADINLTAFSTRQALKKGVRGFGVDARLKLPTTPAED